jgi:hypothetical protein
VTESVCVSRVIKADDQYIVFSTVRGGFTKDKRRFRTIH